MSSTTVFALIGALTLSYLTLRFLRFIFLYARPSSLKKYRYGREPWALVTGASDGIGFGFAQELALNGFNVVIHGRNLTKLEERKSRLDQEFPNIRFKILVADASNPSDGLVESLVASLVDIHLTVLVNNVGGSLTVKPLEDYTAHEVDNLINLNARFPVQLTRALLPRFTKTSDPILIMTIGSLGDAGVPYAVPYGSSKAFDMSMSASLEIEVRSEGKNIEAIGIRVGAVTEVTHRNVAATFLVPGARTMAKAALARVGSGKPIVVGYYGHAIQRFVFDALPVAAREIVIVSAMKKYKDTELRSKFE